MKFEDRSQEEIERQERCARGNVWKLANDILRLKETRLSEDIQTEKMVDRSGQLDERNSSNAQIRTLLEEQRQTIIAEYREKVGHHELQAAHAEEERRLLQ